MHPWLRPSALVALSVLLLSGAVRSQPVASYNVTLRSNIDVYPGANDCWGYTALDGTELAIYGHETGTSFVDATDPGNAFEVFNLPGPTSVWRDIKTYQNFAYVVTEGPGAGTGLQIVDLTDPHQPVHVATYTGSGFTTAHNIWIDTATGVAYACGASGGGMHILSLADPVNPVELDFFNPYYIHDLYVGNGRAYAGAINSGSLRIIDVSNPANPFTIASHFYSGAVTHNAWPIAGETHCATSDETGGGHMKIWNIQNLQNISLVSEYVPSNEYGVVHNIIIREDMAYISHYKAGVRIVDVTNPANPVEVGYYDTHPQSTGGAFDGDWGVYPFRSDDVLYASDRQNGLFVLEFTGGFAGRIHGVVRDAVTTAGLDSAAVAPGGAVPIGTDGTGSYSGWISGGTYPVVTTRFGYAPDTSMVVVPEHGEVVHDVALDPLPLGAVDVHLVKEGTTDPVVGAVVEVPGTPVVGYVSDGAGIVSIPALPAGLTWTVRAAKFGRAITEAQVVPVAGSTVPLTIEMRAAFHDDFEIPQGWTAGAPGDDATDGLWERAIPIASSFLGPVGPDADASPTGEGWAYVTENHVPGAYVGTSDVDGGHTTLLSPVFDGTGQGDLTLTYQRWFSNRAPEQSDDEFRVDVSTDGGSTWTNLETVSFGTDAWAAVSIDLAPVVPATATMRLRFVAEDLDPDTYVEGGLDDVEIVTAATGVRPSAAASGDLRLSAASPNPFRERTVLAFDLPATGPASLEIFDVAGRRVAVLLAGERVAAGTHRAAWSGRDGRGERVAPGVYFAKLTAADGTRTEKVVRLR